MLTVTGRREKGKSFCDGMSRRNFIRIGTLGGAGLTLPGLLRAEAESGKRSNKSVIMIYLVGGPPHPVSYTHLTLPTI